MVVHCNPRNLDYFTDTWGWIVSFTQQTNVVAYRWDGPDDLCPTTTARDLVPHVVLASPSAVLSATVLRLNCRAVVCFPGEMGTGIEEESYTALYGKRDPVPVALCWGK